MRDQIQEIKDAIDIVQLIGECVHLSRAGKSFKGLCPFHSEKTPSFFVTPDIQRYKCFGCGKSGDAFTFLTDYEGLTFAESMQQLATQAGITLEQRVFSKDDIHRQRLYEVLSLAREYYHFLLTEHKLGQAARDYLKTRGVSNEVVTTFKLGFALDSWDALQKYLIGKKKYSERELIDAGLIIPGNSNRPYDRFRGRLMFPLTDAQGKVTGFSGRVLDPKAKEAKYINSPETALYHKSELLFGYSVVKSLIKKEDEVFVVEGELDMLSSYQAGVKNIVAIKGSALTEQQVRLLSRVAKHVVLALDADSAGIEATVRAIEVAKPFDISLRVLPVEGGKDPDEIARESAKAWREMTKHTISAYEFLINAAFTGQDMNSGEGKRTITQKLVPVLASIGNAVEQAFHIEKAAERLDVKQDALETEVRKYIRKQQMGGFVSRNAPQKAQPKEEPKQDLLTALQHYLVALALHGSPAFVQKATQQLSSKEFEDQRIQKIWTLLQEESKKSTFTVRSFAQRVPDELQPLLSEIFLEQDLAETENEEKIQKEWDKSFVVYREQLRKHRRGLFAEKIAKLEALPEFTEKQEEEYQQLLEQLTDLGK